MKHRKQPSTNGHEVVRIDEWAPGQKRIWCACGARCVDKSGWLAEDIHRIHVNSQS